jgi:hypothetical protein
MILGPLEEETFMNDDNRNSWNVTSSFVFNDSEAIFGSSYSSGKNNLAEVEALHRRLGFLPDYVTEASTFRESSMSFATLITLFVTMASLLLIFLSCFYHNQK